MIPPKVKKVYEEIHDLRIQGATAVAVSGMKSLNNIYNFSELKQAIRLLKSARPNEPLLFNGLTLLESKAKSLSDVKELLSLYLEMIHNAGLRIISNSCDLIKNNSTIMTHCHSSLVTKTLIHAAQEGKIFHVINTETRPLYQGRITSLEIAKAGIPVTHIVDSEAAKFMDDTDIILVGCDVLGKDYFMNKIGTQMYADLANIHSKKMYSLSQLLKFTPKNMQVEQRNYREVWPESLKNLKIENPDFDKVKLKNISGVITEEGILKENISRKAKQTYPWLKV